MNCSPQRSNILQPSASFSSNKPLTLSLAKNQLVFRVGDISSASSSSDSPSAGGKKKSLPIRDSAGGRKSSFGLHPPASVARRNARERNRVKQVNSGFNLLRQHIPILCGNTVVYGGTQATGQSANSKKNKMSKVETLRYAVEYIKNLEKLLAEGDGQHRMDSSTAAEGCYSPSSSSLLSDENLSPDVVGANGSGNEPPSSYSPTTFYESSASPQESPQTTATSHPSSPAKFIFPDFNAVGKEELKQEILRALACYKEQDQFAADEIESILGDASPAAVSSGIQGNTVLDPLTNWWLPNV